MVLLSLTYRTFEKANAIDHCLENRFTAHDLCDEDQKRRVMFRVKALLETVKNISSESIRPM
jgi:hypothetical protein